MRGEFETDTIDLDKAQAAEASAGAALDGLDPALLELVARDIEIAHQANPNSWALYRIVNGDIVLSVEAVAVATISASGGDLNVLGDTEDSAFQSIDRTLISAGYKYFQGFKIKAKSVDHLVGLATEFAVPHREAIVDLARRVVSKTNRAAEHQPRTLDALSALVGRGLPRPAYQGTISPRSRTAPSPLDINAQARMSHDASPGSVLDRIRRQFAATGLYYTREQIATFYTALQTKGFVVLSGVSGTGKSKIATGFVEMLPVPRIGKTPTQLFGVITSKVNPDMKKNRRITIPVKYHDLLSMEIGERVSLPITIDGKHGTGRLWLRMVNGREHCLLNLHQSLAAEIEQWEPGQHIYLQLRPNADGDRIAEIHITDAPPVSDDVDSELPAESSDRKNHLFLSVRPDWRDSTSLLGYYNPLTQTYEWTEFLRFLLRAQESYRAGDGLAWFVILDEMNLAHVEYYFADLLSVIESGRDADGWTREPIRLTYPDTLDDEVPPQELRLPPNLYLIGTVNMDETTHAFSPKVLDRAFTIELSDVDFLSYQLAGVQNDMHLDPADKQRLLDALTRLDPATGKRAFAWIDKGEVAAIVDEHPEIRTRLDALNKQLQRFRFHFGYRVFDEIAQYLFNNRENGMMAFQQAFDQTVFMKVLPKFSGSRARLRGPLMALLAWTLNPEQPEAALATVAQALATLTADDPSAALAFTAGSPFPITANRAMQMLIALETDGFVSFG